MDLVTAILGVIRVILGLFLILFLPGYAIIAALYPEKDEIPVIERLGYSFVMSIVSVMLSILFIDLIVGVDTTALNITLTILIVSALGFGVWGVRRVYLTRFKGRYPIGPFLHTYLKSLEAHARELWTQIIRKR